MLAIFLIVLLISRYKLHAFLALIAAAYFVGLTAGMNPVDVTTHVMKGFGGTAEKIGIVIIAGTIIGTMLERTGAALTMAEGFYRSRRWPLHHSDGWRDHPRENREQGGLSGP